MSHSQPTYDELVGENQNLRAENDQLRAQVAQLTDQVEKLSKFIDELSRKPPLSVAPFRLPEKRRKKAKKRPGRKDGHQGACRAVPDQVDRLCKAPLERCPGCGGPVHDIKAHAQYVEELLPPRRHVTKFVSYTGRCPTCGPVRSRHPEQPPMARGCAKVSIGMQSRALAAYLKAALGLTFGKIRRFFGEFGLSVSRGWLVSVQAELAERLEPTWRVLTARVRASPSVHVDETSWYVGEPGWLLWVFARADSTVYSVQPTRSSSVVEGMLGPEFGGVLVSDCLSSYDPIECEKQKCYSHHLKALSESIERLPAGQTAPLERLKLLLRAGLSLWKTRGNQSAQSYRRRVEALEGSVDAILDDVYPRTGVDKALHRFRKHRAHLFTYLHRDCVEPTNNLAERQLRPAVISRKLSCGNRTERGAHTWQTLASVAATCRQRGRSFWETAHQAFASPQPNHDLLAA